MRSTSGKLDGVSGNEIFFFSNTKHGGYEAFF
jgi:hypothetical protein